VRASYVLRSDSWIADAHVDLLLELAWRRAREEENPFGAHWLPPLRAGGVRLQVCPVYVEGDLVPDGALRAALSLAAAFHAAVRENDDVHQVSSAADLTAVEQGGSLGLMLSIEGAEALGSSPELVDAFWALGVRMVGLTWSRRNAFADGSGEPSAGGLSRLGEELVDRLAELGGVVDLAHASERTFEDVLARTDERAALLVSHTCCRALRDIPRNTSDDQLRAIAERDGLVGIMALASAVDPEKHDLERYLDHVDHAISVAGAEHVCLGADFMAQLTRSGAVTLTARERKQFGPGLLEPGTPVIGLAGPEDYPELAEGLRGRGHGEDTVTAVLHGNLLRFLHRALPAPD
jgi:membrane dipeptidase